MTRTEPSGSRAQTAVRSWFPIHHYGKQEKHRTPIRINPAAIFVLEKAMAGQRTDKDELEQYLSMLATVDMILKTLRADTLGYNACPRLAGMTIKVANTVPVYKVFGSWVGWMIEIEF